MGTALARRQRREFKVENAQILFKPNFEGRAEQFNTEGNRYFNLQLTKEQADAMAVDGWNVKTWGGTEEGEEPYYFLKVAVSYRFKPPRLVLITTHHTAAGSGKARTPLDEDLCECLDWTEFDFIDVIVEGSPYSINGKTGIKAYLKTGFFIVHEDELQQKYGHLPEVGMDPVLALPPGDDPNIVDAEVVSDTYDEEAHMRRLERDAAPLAIEA